LASDQQTSVFPNAENTQDPASGLDAEKDADADADADDDDGDDDEDAAWGSDSSGSSSSDDEDAGAYSQLKGRARWLKKNTVTKEKKIKKKEDKTLTKAMQDARYQAAEARLAAEAITATKSILPADNLTPSLLNRKVRELAAQRGRRSKDHRSLLRELEALYRLSHPFGPRVEVPILMHVISAQFGLQRTLDDYMDTPTWKSCAAYLQRITDVLDAGYVLGVETIDESDLMLTHLSSKRMKAAATASDGGAMAAVAADDKLVNPHTGETETEDERAERM